MVRIMETEKKKTKPSILIWKHSDNLKIEKDSYNFTVTHKNKQTFYSSLAGAIKRVSDIFLVEKFAKIPDSEKESMANVLKILKEHDEYIKKLFGGH